VVASLSRLPPLVVSWEIEALRAKLAQAQRGEQFLLQGGDCAESFEDCESDNIAKRLKILLQMSLVLLQGLKKPIIRVGRFAGQYAKPRSADTETRDGVTLPCTGATTSIGRASALAEREPDPELLLRGYERASLTLNFVRALIDGGFADLHHPGILGPWLSAPRGAARCVSKIVDSIAESLEFFESMSGLAGACGDPRRLLHQPRGSASAVRAGADPLHRAAKEMVQPVHAHALDRHAHRQHRRRAHRVFPGHRQSHRRQGRRRHERAMAAGAGAGPEPAESARPSHLHSSIRRSRTSNSGCPR
jgi:hypothetical protein